MAHMMHVKTLFLFTLAANGAQTNASRSLYFIPSAYLHKVYRK